MRQRRLRLAFLFICMLPAVGCNKRAERADVVVVQPEVSPHPARVGVVTVMFTLEDGTALPVKGAHVRLEADMSHPGMNPVFAEAQRSRIWALSRSQLTLGMAGDWVILVHGTLGNGTKFERQFAVNVRKNE